MPSREFEPKLLSVLREGYSRAQFLHDALAGVVVGIVAFPLAIAFAIASGVRPEQGLITAVVGGLVVAVLSGSRVQIAGPTGAFVVLVYGVIQRFGYEGLAVATIMAGVMLIGLGLARLGAVIRFVPYPVTVGFTSGIAMIIAAGQVRDALGLPMDVVPAEFVAKWAAYAGHFSFANPWAIALCAGTMVVSQLWPRISTKIPGPLVALVAATAAAKLFDLPVDTIGHRFGTVPSTPPMPRLPQVDWSIVPQLVSPAISIALLGGIESLLSAVVADGMTGRRHRSNAELIAQGAANIASPLFGGIPVTGAIARTATNVKNGGRTPVAGLVHALVLLAIVLLVGRWAVLIPMAALAGILLIVAWHMSEWRVFISLLRSPRSDVTVLLITFLLTVLVDLVVAIQVGVVMASLLFMRRMADVSQVRAVTDALAEDEAEGGPLDMPKGVEVFEIRGSFFFGSAQKFSEVLSTVKRKPKVVILQVGDVLSLDATGMRALEEILDHFRHQGTRLLLSGLHAQPLIAMQSHGLLDKIGIDNALPSLETAVERARELVAPAAQPSGR